MRVLVLSDIHANLAALEAVLQDAATVGYDTVWCLGDTVGYGPEPDECIALVQSLSARGWWAITTGRRSAAWTWMILTRRRAAWCCGRRHT